MRDTLETRGSFFTVLSHLRFTPANSQVIMRTEPCRDMCNRLGLLVALRICRSLKRHHRVRLSHPVRYLSFLSLYPRPPLDPNPLFWRRIDACPHARCCCGGQVQLVPYPGCCPARLLTFALTCSRCLTWLMDRLRLTDLPEDVLLLVARS